ncbi:hypothetical protein ARMGADRAFT_878775, partial [Armillaria gallica]
QESMEHILIECSIEGQSTLWNLARELWEMRGQEWIPLTYRVALSATLVQIMKKDGTINVPETQLYCILITETVHMIWKICCNEDLMQWHTKNEVHSLWIDAVNRQLTIDHLLVNKKRYGSRVITKAKVLSTWIGTL